MTLPRIGQSAAPWAPSVAISTLDRADALAICLASLSAGELRPAEVVVVDQSAGDATREVVERQRAAGTPLVYLRQERRGLGASQNLAVSSARGPVVAVIDDDCVADRAWLATIAGAFARGDVDLLAGRVLPLPPQGDRVHAVSSRTSTVRRDFRGRSAPWHVGSGNNFAVRRALFLEIGGCDERLGPGSAARGGVDMDLFYRLLRAGARARYEPDALVHHERQTRADRLARRPMYGRGTGAAIAFWLRQGDVYALRVLGAWGALRLRLLASAARRGDSLGMREELSMLESTVRGIAHGFSVPTTPAGPPVAPEPGPAS